MVTMIIMVYCGDMVDAWSLTEIVAHFTGSYLFIYLKIFCPCHCSWEVKVEAAQLSANTGADNYHNLEWQHLPKLISDFRGAFTCPKLRQAPYAINKAALGALKQAMILPMHKPLKPTYL